MKLPLTLTTTVVDGIETAILIRDAEDWAVARLYPTAYYRQCGEALVRAYNAQADVKLWIITFTHRHGFDTWPYFGSEPPDLEQQKAGIDWEGEEKGDYLDVTGPFDLPQYPA